jgi:hypothetical protein
MPDQAQHRQPVEPGPQTTPFEDDIRGVLVSIEQDPYDEDGHVADFLDRWTTDESIDDERFRNGLWSIVESAKAAREVATSEYDEYRVQGDGR